MVLFCERYLRIDLARDRLFAVYIVCSPGERASAGEHERAMCVHEPSPRKQTCALVDPWELESTAVSQHGAIQQQRKAIHRAYIEDLWKQDRNIQRPRKDCSS
jgi:hypothetical protein